MANKISKTPDSNPPSGHGRNYLIVARDGTMLLASGSTGKVRKLTAEESKQVLPLLKQRQLLGSQLADLLHDKDFALAVGRIIDLEVGED